MPSKKSSGRVAATIFFVFTPANSGSDYSRDTNVGNKYSTLHAEPKPLSEADISLILKNANSIQANTREQELTELNQLLSKQLKGEHLEVQEQQRLYTLRRRYLGEEEPTHTELEDLYLRQALEAEAMNDPLIRAKVEVLSERIRYFSNEARELEEFIDFRISHGGSQEETVIDAQEELQEYREKIREHQRQRQKLIDTYKE